MKKQAKQDSEVIKLLDIVWENCSAGVTHSWGHVNGSMRSALELAIGGFKFDLGDFDIISDRSKYNFGYWCGDSVEWIYSQAIHACNMSAVHAFEKWKGREPFIADEVTFDHRQNCYRNSGGDRKKERLFVGAWFRWQGIQVKVTSFSDDQSYVNACSYKARKKGEYGDKIDKRFKLNALDIKTGRAEMKERKELVARMTFACADENIQKQIIKALKTNKRLEINAMSLKKIREVADKYAPKSIIPVITQEHIDAALNAGVCRTEILDKYRVGTPITKITSQHWEWVKLRLPQFYKLREKLGLSK